MTREATENTGIMGNKKNMGNMEKIETLKLDLVEQGHACTIETNEIDQRLGLLERIQKHIRGSTKTEDRVIFKLDHSSGTAHDLLEFIIKEQQCCAFFDFSLRFPENAEIIEFHIGSTSMEKEKLFGLVYEFILPDQ